MKDILKLGGLLFLINIIAATSLAAIYSVTKPRIEAKKQEALDLAKISALPGADIKTVTEITNDKNLQLFKAYTDTTKTTLVGYAFVAKGDGYSSTIESIVGVDTAGSIIGLKVMYQAETPGLGTKVNQIKYGDKEPWFLQQFIGKFPASLAVDKDGGEIQSITGATISSRALTNSIVFGYEDMLTIIKTDN
ncbi:MAG TPA: RnfABCDGE type electron transport complex subunit G [bacterium]|nr:RnfABCDGE type electron transport complex subunit G [bacterium]HPN41949.1 RnfABCDGE type electron transport complex subunit G [bacterium]